MDVPLVANAKEDFLAKPTIRVDIPLLRNTTNVVDIEELLSQNKPPVDGQGLSPVSLAEFFEEVSSEENLEDSSDESESETDNEKEDILEDIEEKELTPWEIESLLPAGPKVNRFAGVIQRIERMYGGEYSKGRNQDDYDREDSFIDDSEWKTYTDAPKTKHDGFFINKGTLELASDDSDNGAHAFEKKRKRKKKRSLSKHTPQGDGTSNSGHARNMNATTNTSSSSPSKSRTTTTTKGGSKEPPQKKQKSSGSPQTDSLFAAPKPKPASVGGLPPSVEEAVKRLEAAVLSYPVREGGKKRLPRELEPYLYQVAVAARSTLPQGRFTSALIQRVSKSLPFTENTLRQRMKQVMVSMARTQEHNLDMKINELLNDLKLKVSQTLQNQSKLKWGRESGKVLRTIIELVEERVRLHNKLNEKVPEAQLDERIERKQIAAEIAKFWPDDQMKASDVLRKNSALKSGEKKKAGLGSGNTTGTKERTENQDPKDSPTSKNEGEMKSEQKKKEKKEEQRGEKEEKEKEEKEKLIKKEKATEGYGHPLALPRLGLPPLLQPVAAPSLPSPSTSSHPLPPPSAPLPASSVSGVTRPSSPFPPIQPEDGRPLPKKSPELPLSSSQATSLSHPKECIVLSDEEEIRT